MIKLVIPLPGHHYKFSDARGMPRNQPAESIRPRFQKAAAGLVEKLEIAFLVIKLLQTEMWGWVGGAELLPD